MSYLQMFFFLLSFLSSIPSISHHIISYFVHQFLSIHCSNCHLFHFVAEFFEQCL